MPPPRSAWLAIAGLVTLAGCVHLGPPPVGVQALQANVVFSTRPAPPAPPSVAPPVPPSPTLTGPTATPTILSLTPEDNGEPVYKFRPPLPATAPCPAAGPNAYPSAEAPDNARGLPAAGSYRWKRSGTYQLNIAPGQTFAASGLDTRLVRNVQQVAPDGSQYTFETVAPDFAGNTVITEWQVKTAALSVTPTELSVSGNNVGDPERGLALKAQKSIASNGQTRYDYTFSPAVLFVPLPVQAGVSFQGVGVDAGSGETLVVEGAVDRHQRVDACGQILDGWQVNSTETFSGAQNQPATYNYLVGTQYGAMIIGEHIDTTTTDGHFVIDYALGQVDPSPLPGGK